MEEPEQYAVANRQLTEPVVQQKLEVPAESRASTATGESVFETKNVSIYYGSFRAVTDVSLTIHEHEITAFIGPSGCGKTTVLRTLNRMNDLVVGARVEGDVHYRGASLYTKDVSAIAVRRRIGMVFQKPNPFPKSIFDNVAYGPRINGKRNKGKLEEIVERLAAPGRAVGRGQGPAEASPAWACPAASSSGCASRARSPSSPTCCSWTSPARPWTRSRPRAIEDLMHEIKREYTIVIVTHNMQQATRVSDRTAFFSVLINEESDTRTGVLVEYDRTAKLFQDPNDSRTRAYVTGRMG